MSTREDSRLQPPPNQIVYANMLVIGVWIGLVLMFVSYAIYAFGILPPHVDFGTITGNWDKGIDQYLSITNSPHGWGWTGLLHRGDFLNYLGFVLLALMTVFCYLVLLRGYLRQKNRIFAVISLLEILVLSLAASGIFGGGH